MRVKQHDLREARSGDRKSRRTKVNEGRGARDEQTGGRGRQTIKRKRHEEEMLTLNHI